MKVKNVSFHVGDNWVRKQLIYIKFISKQAFSLQSYISFLFKKDLALLLFSLIARPRDLIFLFLATSSCTIAWGDIGCNTICLSRYRKEYWFDLPWCIESLSNYKGRPSRILQACIGTKSHSTTSLCDIIVKLIQISLVTFALPLLFNHWM